MQRLHAFIISAALLMWKVKSIANLISIRKKFTYKLIEKELKYAWYTGNFLKAAYHKKLFQVSSTWNILNESQKMINLGTKRKSNICKKIIGQNKPRYLRWRSIREGHSATVIRKILHDKVIGYLFNTLEAFDQTNWISIPMTSAKAKRVKKW